MAARIIAILLLVLAWTPAMAADGRFDLRIDHHSDGGRLTVIPALTGPSGAVVRYEMVSAKIGTAGKSNTRQSGRAALDKDGTAKLSTLRLSLGPQDRYDITVTVFEGATVVTRQTLSVPK